jgi:hypothetical protein
MRIENQVFPQSLLESSKTHDKKDVTSTNSRDQSVSADELPVSASSSYGSVSTYSVSSLKAAVDYHVKFLSVAENNMKAIQHPSRIPQVLIDRFKGVQ